MRVMYDCRQVRDLLEQGGILVDVRTHYEYSRGALDDARHMPINSFEYSSQKLDRARPILLYCRTGQRSEMAKRYLQSLGFPHVYNIGGYRQLADCA